MRSVLIAFFALCLAVSAFAAPEVKNSGVTTGTFQDGRQPASDSEFFRDTYIASAVADTGKNFGAADSMRVSGSAYSSTWKGGVNHILIDFDFAAALTDSAEIRRCRLCLYMLKSGTGTNTDTLEVTRVFNAWNEGTGTANGSAQATNADWNNRTALAWNLPGASQAYNVARTFTWVASADSNTITPTFVGADSISNTAQTIISDNIGIGELFIAKTGAAAATQMGWMCVDLTRDARNVHSGAYGPAFQGWLIRTHNNQNNKQVTFASSENGYKARRPYMVIDYVDLTEGIGGSGGIHMGPGTIGVRP